jgi:hypothetical protein
MLAVPKEHFSTRYVHNGLLFTACRKMKKLNLLILLDPNIENHSELYLNTSQYCRAHTGVPKQLVPALVVLDFTRSNILKSSSKWRSPKGELGENPR